MKAQIECYAFAVLEVACGPRVPVCCEARRSLALLPTSVGMFCVSVGSLLLAFPLSHVPHTKAMIVFDRSVYTNINIFSYIYTYNTALFTKQRSAYIYITAEGAM